MKKLMDRLLARQRELMQDLEAPRPVQRIAPEVLAERLESERKAIDAAFETLSGGDLVSAAALLEPHADEARDARTLITLSRVRSATGRLDEALELLQRADALDPSNIKVPFFLAELLQLMGRHQDAIGYRRRIAFSAREAPSHAFISLIATIVKASAQSRANLVPELRVALNCLRKSPDVTPAQLAEAARLAFTFERTSAEAIAMFSEADPCPPTETEAKVSWTNLWAASATAGREAHRLAEEGEAGHRPGAAELNDVVVHPAMQWVPVVGSPPTTILSGIAVDRIAMRNEDPASPLVLSSASTALLRLPKQPLPRFDQLALLVGGNGDYCLDTLGYLSVLALAERLGFDRNIPLVVNDGPAPHMTELLELLGYGDVPLIHVGAGAPARFDRLLVTTRLMAGTRWFDPMLVRWYRERLVEPLGALPPPTRKLYIPREDTTRGELTNEAEVIDALVPLGFEVVPQHTMSVKDRVALFAQASHVVGPSGAGLTNIIFAPARARVIVLENKLFAQRGGGVSYEALGACCGHQASTHECAPLRLGSGQRAADADVSADIESLIHSLA